MPAYSRRFDNQAITPSSNSGPVFGHPARDLFLHCRDTDLVLKYEGVAPDGNVTVEEVEITVSTWPHIPERVTKFMGVEIPQSKSMSPQEWTCYEQNISFAITYARNGQVMGPALTDSQWDRFMATFEYCSGMTLDEQYPAASRSAA